jgi:hypothetical protein
MVGGPDVFDAIYTNKPDSWSDPAVISSCSAPPMCHTCGSAYFTDGLFTDAKVDAYVKSGQVPVVKAAESKLASSPDAAFLQFVFNLTNQAPNFQQSWDQALSPAQAEALISVGAWPAPTAVRILAL